jgi:NADH dehydrogenase
MTTRAVAAVVPRVEQPLWGALAGLLSGLLVGLLTWPQSILPGGEGGPAVGLALLLVLATMTGAVLAAVVGSRPGGLPISVSGGLLLGLLAWIAWSLTVEPLLRGQGPTWSAAAAGETLRQLVGDVVQGGLTGATLHGLLSARARMGARAVAVPLPERSVPRVVIVGGGFAGVSAARRFEEHAARGVALDVTLVSQSNYLLFTPMLAEVASSALQARHISVPVRASCPLTRFRRGKVDAIDLEHRVVHVSDGLDQPLTTVPFDHLVLGLGAVPHFHRLPGIEEHAFSLKTLEDATRLRNHVLGLLERAEGEPDAEERRRQLTFAVAGGGFAGTEMVAELFDLVHGVLHFYPRIRPRDPRFVLVHSGDRILPELSPRLAEYALDRLRGRGIEFWLTTRVAGATADAMLLQGGDALPTRTLVWTAGTRPHPLLASLPGDKGRAGAVRVDGTLAVTGLDGVWAVGDCAEIPDPGRGGLPYPPTAQHATREGRALADNVVAVLRGEAPAQFRFRTIGTLVALGHRTAVAEVLGQRFSGLAAWVLWRGVYLAKLPGLERKLRVFFDWSLDLVLSRDIVATAGPSAPAAPPAMVATRVSS